VIDEYTEQRVLRRLIVEGTTEVIRELLKALELSPKNPSEIALTLGYLLADPNSSTRNATYQFFQKTTPLTTAALPVLFIAAQHEREPAAKDPIIEIMDRLDVAAFDSLKDRCVGLLALRKLPTATEDLSGLFLSALLDVDGSERARSALGPLTKKMAQEAALPRSLFLIGYTLRRMGNFDPLGAEHFLRHFNGPLEHSGIYRQILDELMVRSPHRSVANTAAGLHVKQMERDPEGAARALRVLMTAPTARERLVAVGMLGAFQRSGQTESVRITLQHLLSDRERVVVSASLAALMSLPTQIPHCLVRLQQIIAGDGSFDPTIRAEALRVAAQSLSDPTHSAKSAVQPLIRLALNDSAAEVASQAAYILARGGQEDPASFETLIHLLRSGPLELAHVIAVGLRTSILRGGISPAERTVVGREALRRAKEIRLPIDRDSTGPNDPELRTMRGAFLDTALCARLPTMRSITLRKLLIGGWGILLDATGSERLRP
jgi:HEAT repeat protein